MNHFHSLGPLKQAMGGQHCEQKLRVQQCAREVAHTSWLTKLVRGLDGDYEEK
jgi:hypothetical protein